MFFGDRKYKLEPYECQSNYQALRYGEDNVLGIILGASYNVSGISLSSFN